LPLEKELGYVEGVHPKPDMTITLDDDDVFPLVVGQIEPTAAFMSGRIKVKGNIMLGMSAMQLLKKSPVEVANKALENLSKL